MDIKWLHLIYRDPYDKCSWNIVPKEFILANECACCDIPNIRLRNSHISLGGKNGRPYCPCVKFT